MSVATAFRGAACIDEMHTAHPPRGFDNRILGRCKVISSDKRCALARSTLGLSVDDVRICIARATLTTSQVRPMALVAGSDDGHAKLASDG